MGRGVAVMLREVVFTGKHEVACESKLQIPHMAVLAAEAGHTAPLPHDRTAELSDVRSAQTSVEAL